MTVQMMDRDRSTWLAIQWSHRYSPQSSRKGHQTHWNVWPVDLDSGDEAPASSPARRRSASPIGKPRCRKNLPPLFYSPSTRRRHAGNIKVFQSLLMPSQIPLNNEPVCIFQCFQVQTERLMNSNLLEIMPIRLAQPHTHY